MRKRPQLTETRFDTWAEEIKTWITESVSPFEDDTPEKKKARIERSKTDRLFFFQTYLPHYFHSGFGAFHEEWSDIADIRNIAAFIAAPREHAKSTFFSFGVPIHDIVFSLRHFIMLISDTNEQATGFTLPIKLELEDNPRIRHDFGSFVGSNIWKQGSFKTSNGVRVLARGHKDKVRGVKNLQYRPDRVVVDDFENDENVLNPALLKRGLDWLKGTVIGSMGDEFSFTMVGNLFHAKSVLSHMITDTDEEGKPRYFSRIYRALLDAGKADERPLWPEIWTFKRLKQKRHQMGRVSFNREMMNLVVVEDSPFKEEWFQYYDRTTIDLNKLTISTFIDPSAKSGESNDFKAIITVGLKRSEMKFYVLYAWLRHASPGQMFDSAYQIYDAYQGPVGIELNMLEDFLKEAINTVAKKKGYYLPWQGIRHNTNKETRIIGTLSYIIEHGKLLFEKGHSDQDKLLEQLIYITNKTVNDDGPDALEGAVSLLQGNCGSVEWLSGGTRKSTKILLGY
ncbi:Phage protein [Candidatus Magnetomoraceae bacterium gMMP-15]